MTTQSEDVDLMPLRVALNHASGLEPAEVHKFQRLLDRVDAALASPRSPRYLRDLRHTRFVSFGQNTLLFVE